METALINMTLKEVLYSLRDLLINRGFSINEMDEQKKIIVAHAGAGWFTPGKLVLLELSPIEADITRIDITAKIDNGKSIRTNEEKIEEDLAARIYTLI